MTIMKVLVTYYSRTGTTKQVGELIAEAMGAESNEIVDVKERLGPVNYMRAARDAKGMKPTKIEYTKNPDDYDVIILGTPIWWKNIPPATRTFLTSHNLKGKKVVFFITSQAEEDMEIVFSQMRELTPDAELIDTFGLLQKKVKNEEYREELATFIENLRSKLAEKMMGPLVH
ncbi:MAG: flavodoxin [Candidatus Thorarchaeota archaeon]